MPDKRAGRRPGSRPGDRRLAAAARTTRESRAITELRRQLKRAHAQLMHRDQVVNELAVQREELQAQNETLVHTERELSFARDRLSDLFQRAPIPYITLNNAAVITAVNWSASQLLGHVADEIVGSPFALFVAGPQRPQFRQHIAACRRKNDPTVVDVTLNLKPGPVPVQLSSTLSSDGWIYSAIIDLRDRQQAERDRRQMTINSEAASAASEAKDQFLATLSHELRTPLTPIVAAMSALQRLCASAGIQADELFTVIRRNLGYEVRLIDDLLDVTRLINHKMKLEHRSVDVHGVVRDAIGQMRVDATSKDLRIDCALDAERPIVRGDADRLRQVFANLLRNAIKFTPRGGRIEITSSDQSGHVVIAVRDTGEGLLAGDLARIFERFVQGSNARPREGLGLGLPIAHGIVTAHRGQLTVHSAGPGHGATFSVMLRAVLTQAKAAGRKTRRPARDRPTATPAAPKSASGEGAHILFVEDHVDTARLLAQLLERAGYHVTLADSVATAMAHVDGDVDLVVSDIGLPDGSGLDLMRKVVARRGPVPAIALSGYGTREDVRRSRAAGFQRHLMKPVEVAVLVRAIEELRVHGKRAGARH